MNKKVQKYLRDWTKVMILEKVIDRFVVKPIGKKIDNKYLRECKDVKKKLVAEDELYEFEHIPQIENYQRTLDWLKRVCDSYNEKIDAARQELETVNKELWQMRKLKPLSKLMYFMETKDIEYYVIEWKSIIKLKSTEIRDIHFSIKFKRNYDGSKEGLKIVPNLDLYVSLEEAKKELAKRLDPEEWYYMITTIEKNDLLNYVDKVKLLTMYEKMKKHEETEIKYSNEVMEKTEQRKEISKKKIEEINEKISELLI